MKKRESFESDRGIGWEGHDASDSTSKGDHIQGDVPRDFGFKDEEVESDDHASFFDDFLSLSKGLWSFPIYFPTTTYYRALGARRRVIKRVRALVRRRKGEVEAGLTGAKSDIMSCLLCARDDERGGGGVREEEIVDNLITLMMGSNSTAVSLLASFIKAVARDDVIRKAVLEDEITFNQTFGKINDCDIGYENRDEIMYMRWDPTLTRCHEPVHEKEAIGRPSPSEEPKIPKSHALSLPHLQIEWSIPPPPIIGSLDREPHSRIRNPD
ncbi:hypothetical protein QJS10_CPB20g00101 [Acorus calamus]|uniref:Cytochrome P450 n=1 Tax=Acorus calamus TaxID=4465 RepID=A0AAV9C717_ACOCL|nr:hypothetical protein QJS10_CPB20g00101 [Acorus calamus]